jgi:coenzyme F420-0:L-glutamate ligase/coenzyme F420-1:gamma-L-glutamate ligase
MTRLSYSVYGLATPLVRAGDDMAAHILAAAERSECGGLQAGDIVVVAESAVATAEGRVARLDDIEPSPKRSGLPGTTRWTPAW